MGRPPLSLPYRPRLGAARLAFAALLALSAAGPGYGYGEDQALAASRAALGRVVSGHTLREAGGGTVSLAALRGRPLVVSLVYTSCYGSCSFLTRRLAQAVEVARDALGEDAFRVITVGFDAANDTPQRMVAYARQQRIGDTGWLVLGADPDTVTALVDELGFTFSPSPRGFDHVSQVSIVDAAGRVYRQVYGDGFPTPALVEPLKELVWGRAAQATTFDGWVSGLKLLCTVYDPAADRYRFDYSVFVGAFVGIVCLGGVAVFVIRAWSDGRGRPAA
jgi:protein SCO1/2